MINIKWIKRFIELAYLVSSWSKDPSSNITNFHLLVRAREVDNHDEED